jgi:branched-chain amino acid transport system ATP-binding protein
MTLAVSVAEARYGRGEPILHEIAFTVAAGEVLAVVGANGAGKTTLFRALMGRIVSRGTVALDGESLDRLGTAARVRKGLGLVPEEKALFPSLTVGRHLKLAASRASSHEWEAEQVLELFPALQKRHDVAAGYLSGGEQQMLAIARALLLGPRALLLDEPSQGLAPAVAQDVFRALAVVRERGAALVVNEQNASLVRGVADRVIVLKHGRVAAESGMSDLLSDEDLMTHYL